MLVPSQPKIYHICHVDRLSSIVEAGCLWSDAEASKRHVAGTSIGMSEIKRRRVEELKLASHAGLHVGECVPFYFCPRSVMLYIINQRNHPNLTYPGGQGAIVHLEADLHATVAWANSDDRRWAFTLSNAGSRYFQDRAKLEQLNEINWEAVGALNWRGPLQEGKQAEFLVAQSFPWDLVERIGVCSPGTYGLAVNALPKGGHRPSVEILKAWYY